MTIKRKPPSIALADYLTQQINLSGKSQIEIAEELGYDKPNIITMFKQGKTKVPLNKIPVLAKAIGVDSVHLLRMAMLEYSPEIWAVIEPLVGANLVTENEANLLTTIRKASKGFDMPLDEAESSALASIFESMAERQTELGRAAEETRKKRTGR